MHLLQLPKVYRANFSQPQVKPRGEIEINPTFFKGCNYSVIHPNEGVFDGEARRPYTKTVISETFYAKGFNTSADNYTQTSLKNDLALPEKGKTFIVYANLTSLDDWGEIVSYSSSDFSADNRHALSKNSAGNLFLQINDSWDNDTSLALVTGEPALYCGVVETSGTITLYQYSKSKGTESAIGSGTSLAATIKGVRIGNTIALPTGRSCIGIIYYSIVMDRAISLSEFKALAAKPYQIFSSKVFMYFFGPTVEVSVTAVLPGIFASGTVERILQVNDATVTAVLPSVSAISNVVHGVHVVQVSATATIPALTAQGGVDLTAPFYSSMVTASLPAFTVDINVNIGALLSASLVFPAITAQANADYTLPMYAQQITATIPSIQAVIRYGRETLGYVDIISFKEVPYKLRI